MKGETKILWERSKEQSGSFLVSATFHKNAEIIAKRRSMLKQFKIWWCFSDIFPALHEASKYDPLFWQFPLSMNTTLIKILKNVLPTLIHGRHLSGQNRNNLLHQDKKSIISESKQNVERFSIKQAPDSKLELNWCVTCQRLSNYLP